jgi:signal transduction histidine kinase
VVVAAGAVCAWAAARAAAQDRPLVTASGALAAALLGLTVALAMSRHRLAGEYRARTDALRAEASRTANAYAEAARRTSADLESVQRRAREAEVRRRTAAESEASLRTRLKAETTRAAALEGETARLAEVTIPLAVERLRAGGTAETVLSRLPQPGGAAHRRLLDVLVREIGASERTRAAGMAVCASAAGRAQALTTAMLADLREMENRHGEEVLADLLHLDHSTARTGRLADSIAVLTGARSGRRWTRPIVMESVLRGALGRIGAYQRVRLHSVSTSAVAGQAAEGVMHALAELMDNACTFSPPSEEVHVYVQETHSGVLVTIEDAGLVMPEATRVRAEKLVSHEPLDLRTLSGTRLGLAVVGCLARKHGLLVSFRPSSRGGTGVVVLIPPKLLTRTPDGFPHAEAGDAAGGAGAGGTWAGESWAGETWAAGAADPAGRSGGAGSVVGAQLSFHEDEFAEGSPTHSRPAADGPPDPAADGVPHTPLPRRPRGRTLATARHGDPTAGPGDAGLDPTPEEEARAARARATAGSRFSAFREAVGGGRHDEPHAQERAREQVPAQEHAQEQHHAQHHAHAKDTDARAAGWAAGEGAGRPGGPAPR